MVLWLGSYCAPNGGFRKANGGFKMKICNLKSLNKKPSDGWTFSQRRGHFVAKSHFHSPFRSCEMRGWGCEMALACQRWVSQVLSQLRNGEGLRK